jgi:hypothetical protein
MELEKRIKSFSILGNLLLDYFNNKKHTSDSWEADFISILDNTIKNARNTNSWFIEEYVKDAVKAIAINLNDQKIGQWIKGYPISIFNPEKTKTIGVVMAGNIPLVGFFDFFYILMSGNLVNAKLSSQDKQLLPVIASALIHIEPSFKNLIIFTESQLKGIDAIIATGSDNSSTYFEYYFNKYPNIIRKNRNSVAILTGEESIEELKLLGDDIFQYFGLGCRNVSKLYLPENYDLHKIFLAIEDKKEIINNHKYFNNYEYNKAIYLINQTTHLDNGFLLLKEDISLHSPVATLYYEYYKDQSDLEMKLMENKEKIQCIVSNYFNLMDTVKIGKAQLPDISDYADGIDVIKFISSI